MQAFSEYYRALVCNARTTRSVQTERQYPIMVEFLEGDCDQERLSAGGLGHMTLVIPGKKYLLSTPRLCYTHS